MSPPIDTCLIANVMGHGSCLLFVFSKIKKTLESAYINHLTGTVRWDLSPPATQPRTTLQGGARHYVERAKSLYSVRFVPKIKTLTPCQAHNDWSAPVLQKCSRPISAPTSCICLVV